MGGRGACARGSQPRSRHSRPGPFPAPFVTAAPGNSPRSAEPRMRPSGSTPPRVPSLGGAGQRVGGTGGCGSPPSAWRRVPLLLSPSRPPRREPLWPVEPSVPPGRCAAPRGCPGPRGRWWGRDKPWWRGVADVLCHTAPSRPGRWRAQCSVPRMNVYFIRTDADHGI